MRSYSHLSEDEGPDRRFAAAGGRSGAIARRSVGRRPPSPGSCSGTHSLWAGTRRFTPPEPINCAGGVKRSSDERPLYVCSVGDRLAEGWTPEQISGWLKSGNEPRLRTIGCETSTPSCYRTAQEGRGLVALSDASPQTPSTASRQSRARRRRGWSVDP